MSFGKAGTQMHSMPAVSHTPSKLQLVYLAGAFVAVSVTVSLYMSIIVLEIPLERPFTGVFGAAPERISWAPVWVSPLVSSLASLLLLLVPLKTKQAMTPMKIGFLSVAVVGLAAVATKFVMNVGFVVLARHASVADIFSIAAPMLRENMILGLVLLISHAWFLLLLAVPVAFGWNRFAAR